MTLSLNEDRISEIVDHLPHSLLQGASKTHFPVQLPLSFPSPLHHINLLTVLHLVYTTISQPRHSLYLAETHSDAHDLTLRSVFGLYLASDESWGPSNLISAKAWKAGVMTEEKVTEFFKLDIMREKDHPTLPVKIGERWGPGVELAGDLVGFFKRLGDKLPMRCVGEAVLAALGHSEEESKELKGNARPKAYTKAFCSKVIEFERSQADPYPPPTDGSILPASPLRLLQDLSFIMPLLPEIQVALPKPDELSHLSPLPLSLSLVMWFSLIDLAQEEIVPSDLEKLRVAVRPVDTPLIDVLQPLLEHKADVQSAETSSTMSVTSKTYAALQTASVEICRHIWAAARFSRAKDEEGEWKHELSFLDVERMCSEMSSAVGDKGLRVVVADETPT